MKLRIGLSMNYRTFEGRRETAYLDSPYFDALADLGAVPVPLVPTDQVLLLESLLSQLDGVLFTGGLDIDPALWCEGVHPSTRLVHPRRQHSEFLLYEQACRRSLPILAICLGIQMVNVAHGGALVQHLPDDPQALDHGRGPAGTTVHPVALDPRSRLHQWFLTERLTVPSCHHQGIRRLGSGLLAAAVAPDGVVEAIERPDYPFLLAVQWHPERALNQPMNRTIFEKFLEACRDARPDAP